MKLKQIIKILIAVDELSGKLDNAVIDTDELNQRLEDAFGVKVETTPEPATPESFAGEKPKAKASKNEKGVDYGKVYALYKAGWSASKIADEMGASARGFNKVIEKAISLHEGARK